MNRYTAIHPDVAQRARPGQPLSDVEVDILRHLAGGAHDPEIARALEMSQRTLRRYVTAVMRKLGARTRAHAVALAAAQGLITDTPRGTNGC